MRLAIQFIVNDHRKTGSMSMTASKAGPIAKAGRTPPRQPDYQDEITPERLDVIRRLADPDGARAKERTLLYSPAW